MTELEQQLSKAFQQLSTQYALDMKRLADQNLHTQQQLQDLAQQLNAQTKRTEVLMQSLERLNSALDEV